MTGVFDKSLGKDELIPINHSLARVVLQDLPSIGGGHSALPFNLV